MKRYLTLLAFIAIAICSHAVKIDGISYTLNSATKSATVTYNSSSSTGISGVYTYNTSNPYKGSVEIPEKVTYNDVEYIVNAIGASAFASCSALTSVTIPTSVTSIGGGAFNSCTSLTSIEIPNSVTSIGSGAFSYSGLTSVTIPNSVTSISQEMFSGCTSLTSIELPNSITKIGSSAFNNSGLTSLVLPNSVSNIDQQAFEGCENLTDVILPNSITCIKYRTFYGCSNLTRVTIGNAVTEIHDEAFRNCPKLKVFCCLTETAPKHKQINSNAPFYGTTDTKSVSLVVPEGAIDNYKNSSLWRSFGNYYCGIGDIYNVNIVDGGGQPFYGGTGTTALPVGEELTYTRTFSEKLAGKWSALYVPISINVEDYIGEFDIAEIYAVCPNADTNGDGEINASDENRLIINKKTTGVTKPNTPYVIRPKAAKTYTIASADNILYPTETNSLFVATSTDIYTFTGLNTTAEAVGNTQYYMTVNGVLDYSPTNPISIKPNRWLMSIESHGYGSSPSTASNAKPISISVLGEDDEATGIESISTARYNENIYNLNGVKMNDANLPAGIYVKNGKKFVVK